MPSPSEWNYYSTIAVIDIRSCSFSCHLLLYGPSDNCSPNSKSGFIYVLYTFPPISLDLFPSFLILPLFIPYFHFIRSSVFTSSITVAIRRVHFNSPSGFPICPVCMTWFLFNVATFLGVSTQMDGVWWRFHLARHHAKLCCLLLWTTSIFMETV